MKKFWKSLNQLENSEEYRQFLESEFPNDLPELSDNLSRRKFFQLMGASTALAGMAACRKPVEKVIPYVKPPEEVIPGNPVYYATTMPFGTNPIGLIVKTNEGRPTKIEGNPKHPESLGATNAFAQAEILNLYDPDRASKITQNGEEKNWGDFVTTWTEQHAQFKSSRGEGLAVLSPSFASPTLSRLKAEFENNFPQADWFTFEPVTDENITNGVKAVTGQTATPVYHLDKADVVLALDSDFLNLAPRSIVNAKAFAQGRNVETPESELNRLYVAEPTFTVTGANADHRLRVARQDIRAFLSQLVKELKHLGLKVDVNADDTTAHFDEKWVHAVAQDLLHAKGKSLVLAGRNQSADVHGAVLVINKALGNIDNTVSYYTPQNATTASVNDLLACSKYFKAGKIKTLIILGGNPVYDAPELLDLSKVEQTICLASHVNETAKQCTGVIPEAHFLEQWGDTQTITGDKSIIQPMIQPLYNGKSNVELLNLLATGSDKTGYEIVQNTWKKELGSQFSTKWPRILHDGVFQANEKPIKITSLKSVDLKTVSHATGDLLLNFELSPSLYDGRYANNSWMQEMPNPITKVSWDNLACISPHTARELKLKNEQIIEITANNKNITLPVWINPGQADNTIFVEIGYGRTAAGNVGNKVGSNLNVLRSFERFNEPVSVSIKKTGKTLRLASTQDHGSMEGRPLAIETDKKSYEHHPDFLKHIIHHPPLKNLWKEHKYDTGYQWGMAIDLTKCTGCNACMIACQSENNIPVVGKTQVANGREMSWIRLDRYYSGDENDPEMIHQPVGCMHCENAPCEQVCPVAATVHDKEGLNLMTYNRCVGTRYCSNNCPYKVRRFNFFEYTKRMPEVKKMAQNPDVTVRSRGVMEKCTYCVQRLNAAKHDAKMNGKTVQDGDVQTACQQVCPSNAIVFGNILAPNSEVSKLKKRQRAYEMLAELNNRPRTSYLARIKNPNPELVSSDKTENHG